MLKTKYTSLFFVFKRLTKTMQQIPSKVPPTIQFKLMTTLVAIAANNKLSKLHTNEWQYVG